MRAILEERLALMAPARRLRLATADRALTDWAGERPIRLLDAGCGDGLISLAFAKRHPGWTVVGVDLREDMLAGARQRAGARSLANVSFQQGDLLQPLERGEFDAVVALECLSEIPDDAAALRTMTAALRPGGFLIAQVPDRDWRPVLRGSASTWREQVRQGYTVAGFAEVLEESGVGPARARGVYRSLASAAQEIRDRIKDRALAVRLLAFPFLAAAVWLEAHGITWGRPNAIFAIGRRPERQV
jgi:SAM-dependent methyltransferase